MVATSARFDNTFALLLACSSSLIKPISQVRITQLANQGVDWDALLSLAAVHEVLPLIAKNLLVYSPNSLPPAVMGELKQRAHHIAHRNLRLTRELIRLKQTGEAEGLPALAFKGPVLAQAVYGDLALRQFGDLDLLIRPQDVLAVSAQLHAAGYKSRYALPPDLQRKVMRWENEVHFFHPEKRLYIDIHWQLFRPVYNRLCDDGGLWERAQNITLAGAQVKCLGWEDLLLFLCVHGAKHEWMRLKWVCDIAELVANHHELIDWEALFVRAANLGSDRMLVFGLRLANQLLGVSLPALGQEAITNDAWLDPLLNLTKDKLSAAGIQREANHGPILALLPLRLMTGWPDRLRMLFYRVFVGDWGVYILPVLVFPLYFIIRPVRLAGLVVLRLFPQKKQLT